MKKIYLLLIATICSFAFIGCQEDDAANAIMLDILSADTSFSAGASSGVIQIATTAKNISIEADMNWISFTKISSTSIEFDIQENTNAMLRSAQIIISGGDIEKSIPISQDGALFNIECDVVALDPTGKSATEIKFYNNNNYVPEITIDEACDWLSIEKDSKKMSLKATLNYLTPRETTITVDGSWHQPFVLTITQDVANTLDVEEITVGREVSLEPTIVTGTDLLAEIEGWTVEVVDCNYLTVERLDERSFAVNVIKQNIEEKEREAIVNLLDAEGNIFDSVVVKQLAHSVSLLLGEWTLNYGNEEHVIVTIAQHADDIAAGVPVEESTRLQMTGLVGGVAQPALSLAYADNGNNITLTLDCNAVNYGSWSNEDNSVSGDCYLYAVDGDNTTYAGEGAAWVLTLTPATSVNTLTWAPNAALAGLGSEISGIAFVGKSAGSEDSIWGSWSAITTLSRDKAPIDEAVTIGDYEVAVEYNGNYHTNCW